MPLNNKHLVWVKVFFFFSKLPFRVALKLKQATLFLCCIAWFTFMWLVIFCGFVLMEAHKSFLFLALPSTMHVEHPLEILWKGNRRIGLRQHIFPPSISSKFTIFCTIFLAPQWFQVTKSPPVWILLFGLKLLKNKVTLIRWLKLGETPNVSIFTCLILRSW